MSRVPYSPRVEKWTAPVPGKMLRGRLPLSTEFRVITSGLSLAQRGWACNHARLDQLCVAFRRKQPPKPREPALAGLSSAVRPLPAAATGYLRRFPTHPASRVTALTARHADLAALGDRGLRDHPRHCAPCWRIRGGVAHLRQVGGTARTAEEPPHVLLHSGRVVGPDHGHLRRGSVPARARRQPNVGDPPGL